MESSEMFATAGRSIKMGLTACDIVSKWTWAATLLQSSNVAYAYGISGPFWYASGASIQILLFAVLAVEIKRRCPDIHTMPEMIRRRWGKTAHIVFLVFAFITNIIVTAMLILGGSAVVHAITGIDIYGAAILIPVGVMFYTAWGGLRGTFLAAWFHVAVVYIAMCIFMFIVYGTSPDLGSAGKVWENLTIMASIKPVKDNQAGSYLTMYSQGGLIFGVINIIGNFGTVFVDQAYWQGAIAAKPEATYKGYFLGGLCWFTIPFTMATCLGLAANALNLPISVAEADEGLVPPAVAVFLMGKGGAFLIVFQVFMAVTASGSAEQMAVAALITYDIYKQYIHPSADGKRLILVTRIGVLFFGILSGVLAIILLKLKLSLGWVYLVMGIIIGSAVFPIAASITWAKTSAFAAITSAAVTLPLAIMTWLITAARLNNGLIDLTTTGQNYPMLAGNLVALFISMFLCIALSYMYPQDFNWDDLREKEPADAEKPAIVEKLVSDVEMEQLDKIRTAIYVSGSVLSFVLIIAWPILTLPAGVFSKGYFTFWVVLSILWGLLATIACILVPLLEAAVFFINKDKNAAPAIGVDSIEDKDAVAVKATVA
jgi:SSS family transporter